jgi:hypothetical protein
MLILPAVLVAWLTIFAVVGGGIGGIDSLVHVGKEVKQWAVDRHHKVVVTAAKPKPKPGDQIRM